MNQRKGEYALAEEEDRSAEGRQRGGEASERLRAERGSCLIAWEGVCGGVTCFFPKEIVWTKKNLEDEERTVLTRWTTQVTRSFIHGRGGSVYLRIVLEGKTEKEREVRPTDWCLWHWEEDLNMLPPNRCFRLLTTWKHKYTQ